MCKQNICSTEIRNFKETKILIINPQKYFMVFSARLVSCDNSLICVV